MAKEENKTFVGLRLSKENLQLIDKISQSLGLNKTSSIELILTVVRKDEKLLMKMIQKALFE
jgi:ribosomal protein L30/L7E